VTRIPIACSLDTTAGVDRVATWTALIRRDGRELRAITSGVELLFELQATSELEELAAAERACCQWADWQVTFADNGVMLRATANAEPGPAVLQHLFGL
jgi:MerR family transcriptional regulator, copper efflux regulator